MRPKAGKECQSEGWIQGNPFALGFESIIAGGGAQGFQRGFPHEGRIAPGVWVALLAAVLTQDQVKDPVAAVFDAPVIADAVFPVSAAYVVFFRFAESVELFVGAAGEEAACRLMPVEAAFIGLGGGRGMEENRARKPRKVRFMHRSSGAFSRRRFVWWIVPVRSEFCRIPRWR